jgi:type I restriction enzyme R subunit
MTTANPLTEKDFQQLVLQGLECNGYIIRGSNEYDAKRAMDPGMLMSFIEDTQPETFERLWRLFDGYIEEGILNRVATDIGRRGLLRMLWDGVDFDGVATLDLVYPRPSALFDPKAVELYEQNCLSVMEEVWHKEDERIDLVIFLNGLALFTMELKCNTAGTGWDYREAIRQYREDRDCTTRLLDPKAGALAHFAVDLNEAYVCCELRGKESTFLPFNRGYNPSDGDAHATGPGNPPNPRGPRTSYLWEDVLAKDSVFELIYNFIYTATKRDKRGKKVGETRIFPRFQQLRAVRKVVRDIKDNGTVRNYLIEHSAGSGKTNTIAWLAHELAGLYRPGSDKPLFSKVVIVTDRRVVDKQLQDTVLDTAKEPAVVRVMDRDKTSSDLGEALHKSYRIVVTTIQKFLHLEPGTFEGEGARFAVLIDEAHGSTSGKSMMAVNATLAAGDNEVDSSLDELSAFVSADIARSGRQPNVTLIGFTATPTGKTLQQFGRSDAQGRKIAFDLYSMRQAIEERFILDVTANYVTYDSYCRVVKAIDDDPELESSEAKRQLAHLISVNHGTIEGNLAVMVDHFTSTVAPTLGGHAKAMVVCAGREEAVRYFLAYEAMRKEHLRQMGGLRALVAFTGSVKVDGADYTESGINGFSEEKLPDYFDTDDYRILFVADKYQTGFDQNRLAAMYVDKRLSGITCVQTLSRLNRICPPYEKRTYVLDFRNSYDDVRKAFAPYYEDTILVEPLTIDDVRETERRLAALGILDFDDVREFNALLAKQHRTSGEKGRMWALLDPAVEAVRSMEEDEADEARRIIRNFIKQYGFLLQTAPFVNPTMHMEYNFCASLIREIDAGHGGGNDFDIADKVSLEDFTVEKSGEHVGEKLEAEPEVGIAKGTGTGLAQDQFERLSRIIEQWNARYGLSLDPVVQAGSLISLMDTLKADPRVQRSAQVNTMRDFRNTVDDRTEDALVKGYDQNGEWYGFLLNNEDARRQLVHAFVDDVYRSLREGGSSD